jgi:hypothetical protein
VTHRDGARGDATRHQHRLNFPERRRSRARVRRIYRDLGDDRPGAFAHPGLRQAHDVDALRAGEAATGMTDEHHDRAVGFGHGDRMTLAVIIGYAGGQDFRGLRRAGAERRRKAQRGAKHARGFDAMVRCSRCHRSVLVPTR